MKDLDDKVAALSDKKRELLAELLLRKKAQPVSRIPRRDGPGPFRASFVQEQLWLLYQLEPDSPSYNVSYGLSLEGTLDVSKLERSLESLVERHEVLRTTYRLEGERVVQIVGEARALRLPIVDLSGCSKEEQATELARQAMAFASEPIDLERGPILRAKLVRLSETNHALVTVIHHIATDAWSPAIFISELSRFYDASTGAESRLPELPIRYGDFAEWQRELLASDGAKTHIAYWKEKLGGDPAPLLLPGDAPRPKSPSFRGAVARTKVEGECLAALRRLSQAENTTLFSVCLASFAALLHRYTSQNDIVIGTPLSNRNRAELEGLIGFFANTVALTIETGGRPTFRELLRRVAKIAMEAQEHGEIPFDVVVNAVQPTRDLSKNPIFQVMFVYQNVPATRLELPGLTLAPLPIHNGTCKFDLDFSLDEGSDVIAATMEYATDLFSASRIEAMLSHWTRMLQEIALDPDRAITLYPILSEAERCTLITTWNATKTPFPEGATLHELFEGHVRRQPNAVAVITDAETLSYRELDERAEAVARHLRTFGDLRNRPVAICVERSATMVVGLMAIAKAGAAYLPLDAAYPRDRIALMLEDANAPILLTQHHLVATLPPYSGAIVPLDRPLPASATSDTSSASKSGPEDLAYLIYTSGSTGRPKGVMVDHRGRVNNFHDFNTRFGVGPGDRMLALSSLSFDMCAYDVFGMLMTGAAIVLPRADLERDPAHWVDLMRRHGVTLWHSVPALLGMLVDELEVVDDPPQACRLVLLGGDWIPLALPDRFRARVANATVISMGGATEVSMDSTIFPIGPVEPSWNSIPYGVPMANQLAYVLDPELDLVPSPIQGELYLGGIGVGWGYHARPDLTAARFVPNPFSGIAGDRMYRTGDRVRHFVDGNLELLGRIDFQVKVRGYRIEVGEIEAALRAHPALHAALVVARGEKMSDRRLVAYLVLKDGSEVPDDAGWRQFLAPRLPDYMVPSAFVILPAFPLTPNGKIDRKNLPEPDAETRLKSPYVAPSTPIELTLAEIWRDILSIEKVSVHDNFFAVGGDSIRAIRVVSRAREAGLAFTARQMFQLQTIADLASAIGKTKGEEGDVPLTREQSRLLAGESGPLPVALVEVELSPDLDSSLSLRAVEALLRRHAALRLELRKNGTSVGATVRGVEPSNDTQALDLSREELSARVCLTDGKPFAVSRSKEQLLVALNPLVVDAPSLEILLDDLDEILDALRASKREPPSPLPYARAVHALAASYAPTAARAVSLETSRRSASLRRDGAAAGEVLTKHSVLAFSDLVAVAVAQALGGDESTAMEVIAEDRHRLRFGGDDASRTIGALRSWAIVPCTPTLEAMRAALRRGGPSLDAPGIAVHAIDARSPSGRKRAHVRGTVSSAPIPLVRLAPQAELLVTARLDEEGLVVSVESTAQRSESPDALTDAVIAKLEALVATLKSGAPRSFLPSDFPHTHLDDTTLAKLHARFPELEDIYPVSSMQRNMLIRLAVEPRPGLYVIQSALTLPAAVEPALLARAWQALAERHRVLRTRFVGEDEAGRPLQVVLRDVEIPVEEIDLLGLPEERQEELVDARIKEARAVGLDPSRGPLVRILFVKLSSELSLLVQLNHYLLMDGWSSVVLQKELVAIYLALASNEEPNLSRAPDFRSYIRWLGERDTEGARTYFRAMLDGYRPTPLVPRSEATRSRSSFVSLSVKATRTLTETLARVARDEHLTVSTLIQGAWALVLAEKLGRDDVVFGVTTSGRPTELDAIDEMIGLLINTNPVRFRFESEESASSWLKKAQLRRQEGTAHEHLALDDVYRLAGLAQGERLFDVVLVFANYPVADELRAFSGSDETHPLGRRNLNLNQTEFPLRVDLVDGPDLEAFFSFHEEELATDEVHALGVRFLETLGHLLENVAAPLRKLRKGAPR